MRASAVCTAVFAALLVAVRLTSGGVPGAHAQDAGAPAVDGGARAGTWPNTAGGADGMRSGAGAGIPRELGVAWTADLPSAIEEGPVTDGRSAWLSLAHRDPAKTTLHAVDLRTGKLSNPIHATKAARGSLCTPGGMAVVAAGGGLSGYAVRNGALGPVWTADVKGSVVHAVAERNCVFALMANGDLHRFDPPSRTPSWTRAGAFPGVTPAVRDGRVFHVTSWNRDRDAQRRVESLDARTGEREGDRLLLALVADEPGRLVHGGCDIFVMHDRPVATASDGKATASTLSLLPGGSPKDIEVRLRDPRAFPVGLGFGWIAPMGDFRGGRTRLMCAASYDAWYDLSDLQTVGPFLDGWDRATRIGDAVVHPSGLLLGESLTYRRRPSWMGTGRLIPAGSRFLVADPRRITALAPPEDAADLGPAVVFDAPAMAAAGTAALLDDGTEVAGPFRVEGAALVAAGPPEKRVPLADTVAVVARPSGAILAARPGEDTVDRLSAAADRAWSKSLAAFATETVAPSRDLDLMRSVYDECLEMRLEPAQFLRLTLRMREFTKGGKTSEPQIDLRKRFDALRAERVKLREAAVVSAAVAIRADDPPRRAARMAILRAVSERHPGSAALREAITTMLPPQFVPAGGFHAPSWLSFAGVIERHPVRIVQPPAKPAEGLSREELTLGATSHTWRKDLVGVASRSLLAITPVERPDAVADCVATGEAVCGFLESVFEGGARGKQHRWPLTLHLYPTKDEYLKIAERKGKSHLGWTAGHYDPNEQVSHMYLPQGRGAFTEVKATFVHELTHHWLDVQGAYITGTTNRAGARQPGYWIVEGFADFVESCRVSSDSGAVTPPQLTQGMVQSLVAGPNAGPSWTAVFTMSQAQFWNLGTEAVHRVGGVPEAPGVWKMSDISLFYARAGSACAYLFETDREKLVSFVTAWYGGKAPAFEAHFGASPQAMGARVLEWCRARHEADR